ncbi:hypothetical protein B0H15DRAFT_839828 [Mycena belliarum]|uniref:Uncharacterized protein n=1 Tax=Mycena belliarum TaxID=1033014 RepID=A0AAD6XR57_9AGAR|nr:hypothetical protein B0H15DRAFT_839828 [Mycena belliae]
MGVVGALHAVRRTSACSVRRGSAVRRGVERAPTGCFTRVEVGRTLLQRFRWDRIRGFEVEETGWRRGSSAGSASEDGERGGTGRVDRHALTGCWTRASASSAAACSSRGAAWGSGAAPCAVRPVLGLVTGLARGVGAAGPGYEGRGVGCAHRAAGLRIDDAALAWHEYADAARVEPRTQDRPRTGGRLWACGWPSGVGRERTEEDRAAIAGGPTPVRDKPESD